MGRWVPADCQRNWQSAAPRTGCCADEGLLLGGPWNDLDFSGHRQLRNLGVGDDFLLPAAVSLHDPLAGDQSLDRSMAVVVLDMTDAGVQIGRGSGLDDLVGIKRLGTGQDIDQQFDVGVLVTDGRWRIGAEFFGPHGAQLLSVLAGQGRDVRMVRGPPDFRDNAVTQTFADRVDVGFKQGRFGDGGDFRHVALLVALLPEGGEVRGDHDTDDNVTAFFFEFLDDGGIVGAAGGVAARIDNFIATSVGGCLDGAGDFNPLCVVGGEQADLLVGRGQVPGVDEAVELVLGVEEGMERVVVRTAVKPGVDWGIDRDTGFSVTLTGCRNRVNGVDGVGDDHDIDLVLGDQLGGRFRSLGRVTFRIGNDELERQFLADLLNINTAFCVDLFDRFFLHERSALAKGCQWTGQRGDTPDQDVLLGLLGVDGGSGKGGNHQGCQGDA